MPSIIITNISDLTISANDLALRLEPGEEVDIFESYSVDQIKRSSDLKTLSDSSVITINFDSDSITHAEMIRRLTPLFVSEHQALDTLLHGVSEASYFESQKQNEQTKYIRTYTDNTKTKLIREEEIIRDINGVVSQIIIRQYDNNGDVVETETQTLNRSVEGTVGSISSSKE